MKKSDSTNTLEEILDLTELQKIELTKQSLQKLDKDYLQSESDYTSLTPPTPNKIKKRSRLSSAFRSLRGNKSSRKKDKNQSDIDTEFITSGEEQDIELLNPIKKSEISKKNTLLSPELTKKKSKISKKFSSLTGIKKYRVNPKKSPSDLSEDNLVTISTQTTETLQRRAVIQDSTNLSVSHISLIDLPDSDGGGGGDSNINTNISEDDNINSTENLLNSFEENSTPVKFDKVKKIQITIRGKKIERINTNNRNLPTTTTSISGEEDYLTATTTTTPTTSSPTTNILRQEQKSDKIINELPTSSSRTLVSETQSISTVVDTNSSSGKRSSRKKTKIPTSNKTSIIHKHHLSTASVIEAIEYNPLLVVTKSSLDNPPKERAPNRPTTVEKNLNSDKGAIRKTNLKLKRQEEHEDHLDSGHFMINRDKSSSLERGRRYPRGPKPIEADDKLIESSEQIQKTIVSDNSFSGNNLQNPNLSGSIAVNSKDYIVESENLITATVIERKPKLQFSVGTAVRPQQTSLISQSTGESKDLSSLGSNKSSDSQSPISESSVARRRIRYNPQPTFYTDEEREILDGKREAYLSGISEYSLESAFSIESQMPAFGDLTMDHDEVPIMTSPSGEKREHLYKILVIGELGTGKTSFIKRYVHQFFSQNYRATIGVDFALKVLHWDQNTIIRLQLWDIAGQERFGNMTRVYYKEAVGAFIVFDVTRSGTFECVSKWKEDLDSKVQLPDGSPIPCILLANKCDQEKQGIITNTEKMDEYVKDNGFAGWFETSAKENVNIDEAARALVNKILLNDKLISAADIIDSQKFNLAGSSEGKKNNCPC